MEYEFNFKWGNKHLFSTSLSIETILGIAIGIGFIIGFHVGLFISK